MVDHIQMTRFVGVVPGSWGEDAIGTVLAALQSASGKDAGCDLLILGDEGIDQALGMAGQAGIQQVYCVTSEGLSGRIEPDGAAMLASKALNEAEQPGISRLILTPPGPEGEELAARIAFQIGARALGRCESIGFEAGQVVATRSVWGGRKRLKLGAVGRLAVACLRAGKPALDPSRPAAERVDKPVSVNLPGTPFLDVESTGESLPPVESAKLVVSGGRSLNEEGFAQLEQIARKAKGTLGGSLPAVDAGLVPVVRQVGISGKFVAPELYFAVGISGTPQHMAGVSPDARIVAINSDPEAPIFGMAEAGVVGEWQQLLPEILDALEG